MIMNFGQGNMPPMDLIPAIQQNLIPKLLDRIKQSGYNGNFQAQIETVGESVNIIIHINGQFVQEFAILRDKQGVYWTPVMRVQ